MNPISNAYILDLLIKGFNDKVFITKIITEPSSITDRSYGLSFKVIIGPQQLPGNMGEGVGETIAIALNNALKTAGIST